MPFTYPDDHFNGFLSSLKGSTTAAAAAAPTPPSSTPDVAHPDLHAVPVRVPHPLNGFTPSTIQNYSAALSSDRLSAGGPVSRTFSGLRGMTGEASIGSFSNNGVAVLHPIPPSLSADAPLPQPLPQRSPTSPIPHVHMSAFANNPAYHSYPTLSHLNHSPSTVARQTLNYSPQPPSAPSNNHTSQQPPCPSAPSVSLPAQRHHQHHQPPAHQLQQPPPPATQQQPVHRAQHHPDAPGFSAQLQQPFPTYAHPQQQPMGTVYPPPTDARMMQQQQQQQQQQMHRSQEAAPPPPPPPQSQPAPVLNARPVAKESKARDKRNTPNQGPAKRARTVERPTQLSPTTPRSAVGGGTTAYWGTPAVGSSKSRSATTAPSLNDGTASAPGTTEEQSRPERKREREKRRRETMNTRFVELASCLTISAGGKSDKEGILAEAVDHVKKQANTILELEKQNRELQSEARDLRTEKIELRQDKNYIREERDRLKAELDALKAQLKREESKASEEEEERGGWKGEGTRNGAISKVKEERTTNGMKPGTVKG